MINNRFDSVLIINTGRLGDFVSSFVVINPLRKHSRRVDILCKQNYRDIVENEEGLFTVTEEQAAKNRYDLLLDLTSTSNTRTISRKIKARIKIGSYRSLFHKLRSHALGVYTRSFRSEFNHIVRYYYPFARDAGVECDAVPRLGKSFHPSLVSLFGPVISGPVIGIHISATDAVRMIPEKLIREIIDYVKCVGGTAILIGDKTRAETIGFDSEHVCYRQESVAELIAMLSQLDCLIAPDSGVLHLASALDVKSLGLYGPNLSNAYGPPGDCVDFIELNLPCRPCTNRESCEYNIRCMNDIQFDDLKKFIDRVIAESVA